MEDIQEILLEYGLIGVFCLLLLIALIYKERQAKSIQDRFIKAQEKWADDLRRLSADTVGAVGSLERTIDKMITTIISMIGKDG